MISLDVFCRLGSGADKFHSLQNLASRLGSTSVLRLQSSAFYCPNTFMPSRASDEIFGTFNKVQSLTSFLIVLCSAPSAAPSGKVRIWPEPTIYRLKTERQQWAEHGLKRQVLFRPSQNLHARESARYYPPIFCLRDMQTSRFGSGNTSYTGRFPELRGECAISELFC